MSRPADPCSSFVVEKKLPRERLIKVASVLSLKIPFQWY